MDEASKVLLKSFDETCNSCLQFRRSDKFVSAPFENDRDKVSDIIVEHGTN